MASTRVMDEDIALPETSRIRPSAVRYIKLGEKGALAETCIRQGIVVLQHTEVPHELAAMAIGMRFAASLKQGALTRAP
jgi:hypothetical protein